MRTAVAQALVATVCLVAATPPVWFPGAGFLVLPGLMALYAVVTQAVRPRLLVYLVLALQTLWFSWSLRHVVMVGWLAIGAIAGVYGMLLVPWTRRLRPLPAPLAFALAVAGIQWLRAHMVQFPYPHGQPSHGLYAWPALLGSVRWGGEVLANGLLAGVAAAAVDLYRSWRVALPPWRATCRRAGIWLAVLILLSAVPPPAADAGEPASVRVVAIEPGLEPELIFGADAWRTMLPRLHRATGELDAPGADLVVWPEGALATAVVNGALDPRVPLRRLAPGTRLLAGASVRRESERRTPAAVLLDEAGGLLAHQEKMVLVPGGEYIPFTDILPQGLRRTALGLLEGLVPFVPEELPGRWTPPLQTAAGVPFGTLMCFDNAFDTVVARRVGDGARFLVVLSNEAWYLGGGELEQMVAMTVFRALETGTPLVRGTVDGASLAVDAQGRVIQRLSPRDPGSPPISRVLDVTFDAGPGRLPPMAWLSDVIVAVILLSGLAAVLRRALPCARLDQSPSAAPAAAPDAPPEAGS